MQCTPRRMWAQYCAHIRRQRAVEDAIVAVRWRANCWSGPAFESRLDRYCSYGVEAFVQQQTHSAEAPGSPARAQAGAHTAYMQCTIQQGTYITLNARGRPPNPLPVMACCRRRLALMTSPIASSCCRCGSSPAGKLLFSIQLPARATGIAAWMSPGEPLCWWFTAQALQASLPAAPRLKVLPSVRTSNTIHKALPLALQMFWTMSVRALGSIFIQG